tara:strand:- start:388 stop:1794 length:1407 start_codon:yes stop_codon:yes gene_type:complete
MENHRRLIVESLENRLLLAADIAYQNPLLYQDVNFDQQISSIDALQVINHLNAGDAVAEEDPVGAFLDVSGDNQASAIDALQIINDLNGVEQTNQAIFEQVQDLTSEVELMADLLPEDVETLGKNLLAKVREQSVELVAIRADLEEFLKTPRKNEQLLTERRERFKQRADDLADHYIKEFNKLNADPEAENLEGRDLKKLGLHKRFKAKFDEVRHEKRKDYRWEDYLPKQEVTQEQVDRHVEKLRKAVDQGIVPEHINADEINGAIRSLREYKVFDFRFGDGRHDFQNAPEVSPTEVLEVYSDYVKDGDYQSVDSRHDFIVDQQSFDELWSEWNPVEVTPQIDFEENMVVVATVVGPNKIMMQPVVDANGNLMLKAASTKMWGPGFSYQIQVIPNEGIESVNHVDIDREGGMPTTEELAQKRIDRLRQWKEDGNLPSFISPELADNVLNNLEDSGTPLGKIFRKFMKS